MSEPTALDYAREWLQMSEPTALDTHTHCATKAILGWPGDWVDADKIRDIIDRLDGANSDDALTTLSGVRDALRDLLPAPKPRTLADSDYQRELRELRDKLPDTTTSFDPAHRYRDSDNTIWRNTSTGWECEDGCCVGYATLPAENAPYTRIDNTEDNK